MSKRIYRSKDRKIGGVCGGIAEYFNIDPTIVRLIWAVLAFAYGTGLLAYIVAWIIIPEEPKAF
ncbi:MAG: PspC domain-containing protein [Limnochordia bacterium]|jgi:phage shock protein C|nr:PspC domain-containing protein [Bacillota bacterium]NLL09198.1 PspC domain-containing protein [Bacillota bacterium]HBG09856.1 PspC domain-containing protein [Bacillota bacterium]